MNELGVYFQNKKAFQYALNQEQTIIGRSSESDLILSGESVSRRHALITKSSDEFWVEDLSSHGTFLNGERLQKKTRIQNQDRLRIADWELRFEVNLSKPNIFEETRRTQISELTKHLSYEPTAERVEFLESKKQWSSSFPMLLIQNEDGAVRRLLMKKKSLVVGSASDCDLVIDDEFVSQHHTRLTSTDRGLLVEDLDSTNGTWVDKARVQQICIQESQKLQLGKTTILMTLKSEAHEESPIINTNVFCGIIGQSESMKCVFGKIQKIAQTDMTTLILGETGTGKELVAKAIHDLSHRRHKPYVVINCGAISEQLIESELFGYEKGAFTGAEKQHKGVFEQAHQGTLFLDEVGELPLDLQAKVLRVLEYKTLRRVGGESEIKVDVRIVAATHRDLKKQVQAKRFREDLFYRLYVLPLNLPPLRDRESDVQLLSHYIIDEASAGCVSLSEEAVLKLKTHMWPGNVRELKNTLLRAVAFSDSKTIQAQDIDFLKFDPTPINHAKPEHNTSDERQKVIEALKYSQGDKEKAAEHLGISRATLFRKIKSLNIQS